MQSIEHLTLFTGHLRSSPRKEVNQATIGFLKPYVLKGGGKLGSTGWSLRMVQGVMPGSCGFTLHHSGRWLFSCYMAWTATADAPMWNIVKDVSKTSILKPKSIPWLAVHAMPLMYTVDPRICMEAGDVERCVAWTVIEAMADDHGHMSDGGSRS